MQRNKLKASFYHPIRCLNDPEFFEKLFIYDTSRDPRETVEVKEIKYIVFNRISTYQERRQAVWELLSKGDTCASVGRKINLGESRVCQIKKEMLADLKQTLEGKYGRGSSKFPSVGSNMTSMQFKAAIAAGAEVGMSESGVKKREQPTKISFGQQIAIANLAINFAPTCRFCPNWCMQLSVGLRKLRTSRRIEHARELRYLPHLGCVAK